MHDLKKDFEESIDFYLQCCKDTGTAPQKPYSGKLMLRMPSELHEKVAEIAFSVGTTINEIIKRAVIKEIHTVEAG